MNSRTTQLKFSVRICRITYAFIIISAASQLHFSANKNAWLVAASKLHKHRGTWPYCPLAILRGDDGDPTHHSNLNLLFNDAES